MNSVQRCHSASQPNANRMALPSCTVPTASTPTSRKIHTSEPAAEPFVPNTYKRDATLFGRPSSKVMRPTSSVSTKESTIMMIMAASPIWQPA